MIFGESAFGEVVFSEGAGNEARFFSSSSPLPIGGAVTLQNLLVTGIVSTRTLPLNGSAAFQHGRQLSSSLALPLSGSATLQHGRQVSSTLALTIGGSASFAVAIQVSSNLRLPLGGTVTLLAPISLASTARVPIGGSITLAVPHTLSSTARLTIGSIVRLCKYGASGPFVRGPRTGGATFTLIPRGGVAWATRGTRPTGQAPTPIDPCDD